MEAWFEKKRPRLRLVCFIISLNSNKKPLSSATDSPKTTSVPLELSKFLVAETEKATGRSLIAKPNGKSINKLLRAGVTEDEIRRAVKWLTTTNLESEFALVVHSEKALYEKWDRITAAMNRKPKTHKLTGEAGIFV